MTPSCSLSNMDASFMKKLDAARHIAGFPFVLNCAYRSKEWDINKGRNGKSYHCLGRAVDIRCNDKKRRAEIVFALWLAGIKGIILYPSFIHADDRSDPILLIRGSDAQ